MIDDTELYTSMTVYSGTDATARSSVAFTPSQSAFDASHRGPDAANGLVVDLVLGCVTDQKGPCVSKDNIRVVVRLL